MRAFLRERGRVGGVGVAFVPTMGALHAGHLSLVRRAAELAGAEGIVAASIFVNPLQFGAGEDFGEYPRGLEADLEKLRGLADVVFAPEEGEMYPNRQRFGISLPPMAGELEGRFRPGFFEGVAAAVCKLLNIVPADAAVFGAKDYQQARIIAGMARDLNFRTAIEIAPTVREADGLALSSRNAYLSAAERAEAPRMFAELRRRRRRFGGGRILQGPADAASRRCGRTAGRWIILRRGTPGICPPPRGGSRR